jgi:hypothetical protein
VPALRSPLGPVTELIVGSFVSICNMPVELIMALERKAMLPAPLTSHHRVTEDQPKPLG